jgi:transposase-like protein
MNIIEQGRQFAQSLRELANRTAWDWRRCPRCGSTLTHKHGSYTRRVWLLDGRRKVRVQRHRCQECRHCYSERSPLLVRGSWYGRDVHRCAIDHWQHVGSSLRRTAEWLRSWAGRQERWKLWRPLEERRRKGSCRLSASTVQRWLDGAGRTVQASLKGQLAGVASSGQMGTDGLWARLRGGGKRVVLAVVDSVSGVVWPPVVATGEESEEGWRQLFERAKAAGLELQGLFGVTSDGCRGLLAYLRNGLQWVSQQRCVWHLWRGLARELGQRASEAAQGLVGEAAQAAREQARQELVALMHGILDATSYPQAETILAQLSAHPLGLGLGQALWDQLDAALVHLLPYNRGLLRVAPEWYWRDFRLRLSRGRNHGSPDRLERAALVWAIYRNLSPAQWRSERKRHYRYPGCSPLAVAGASPGDISYLDALGV